MISEELTEQVKNREVAITDSKFCHAPWLQLHQLEMLIKHPLPFLLRRTPHTAGEVQAQITAKVIWQLADSGKGSTTRPRSNEISY